MTRHNLTSELAWLISNKVTPSSTVNARVRVAPQHEDLEIFGIQAEDLEAFEGEDIDLASSPIREPQGEFARPQPIRHPPRPSNAQAQVQSTPILPGPTVMSRHEGDGKGRAPGAMTQYQLATPDSTTTSTAAPSSLAHSYTQMLRRENGGTLATQPQVERLQSRTARSNQTPQTPRKTPRPTIESHLRNVESVDLTEEFTIDTGEPRSSSTEVILHKGPTVWTPAAAARPEPLSRTSKKRKSDDIAGGSSRKRSAKSPQKHRLQEEDDGFMDIDDVVPSQSQASRSHERTEVVQRSVEVPGYDGNLELKETETISRTEKHTRKSISRVSSMNDPIPSNCEAGQMGKPLLPQPRIRHASSPSKSHSNIQVAASPMLNRSQPRVGSSPTPTPKLKHERVSSRKIVQDSDDDEEDLLADNTRVSCSPKRFIKASPKSSSIVGSPRPQYTAEYKPDFQVYRDEPPRTASPLRTISTNLVDRMKSPVPKNSPVRSSLAVTPSTTTREQTVNSSLSIDDKVLVTRYLTDPSLLSSYSERVQTLKAQSAMDCMAYTDRCEPAPSNLRHERMRILDMEKAYIELAVLGAKHQELKAEKKRLANQIARDLDADIDTSDAEERQAAITKIMRECERNVGINLHKSGAVEDGFGTEQTRDSILPISKSSLNFNGSAQQVAGSSAQIILQTQFPSLQQQCSAPQVIYGAMPSNASSHMQDRYEDMEIRCREYSSPVRRQTSAETRSHRAVTSTLSERQRQKAPVAQRQPTEDFDECYDEHFLQLIEEDEQRNDQLNLRTKPGEIEEDYGDDNDDDFLEIAERFESLPSRRTPNSNTALRTPSNTSQQKGKSQSKKDMYAHVDDRAGFQFPWSKEVKKALRERFKLTGFRENQLDAINATLAGEDAFVLMPTGGGKSLCYQLPAIVTSGKTRGVTVVISPLLSLMTDQVDHLMAKHIQAVTLNGEQPKDKRDKIFTALKDPHPDQYIQVLYVTPEMVGKSAQLMTALRGLHQRKRLARIVIDEAHCVSQWGHDFRPDYKTLVELRQKFPGVPYMALTATATQSVKADCIHNLGMENCKEFKQSFNRPNLKYEILPKKGKGSAAATLETMVKLIKETHKNQTGIVYTLSKKGCEDLARGFCENGISAHHFHAGMKPEDKAYVQTAWQTGRFQIVVATIAFGMGIDKPDVRFVIHHTIPKSLEGYYQETGRAGRDGKPSNCYLFYGYQDTAILRRFIEDGEGDRAVKESQRAMLKSMVRYCEDRDDCRRSNILAYFGESFNKEDCNNMCDNCASDAVYETKDMTVLARSAIKLVQQYDDDNLTLLYVVDFLRGANKKFKEHHKDLKCRGMAKDLQRGEVERLLTRLLMDDVLVEDNVVNGGGFVCAYLKAGKAADDFINSKRKLKLPVKVTKSPRGPILTATAGNSKKKIAVPTSTLFSSPSVATKRKGVAKQRMQQPIDDFDDEYDDDDFVVPDNEESDEVSFEPRHPAPSRSRGRKADVGPPITGDKRMQHIPEVHQVIVEGFVDEARKVEERLRVKNNHRTRYFREVDFREMAINWTLNLEEMANIDGIDQDKVQRYGTKFLPLIERCYHNYEDMMGLNDRDMDDNHRNVIDLLSDEDDAFAEDQEEDPLEEEQSRFFPAKISKAVQAFNNQMAIGAPQSKPRKSPSPEAGWKGKGKANTREKTWYTDKQGRKQSRFPKRKSSDSNSSRSRASKSAGPTRKAFAPRKNSVASSKSSTTMRPSLMEAFGRSTGGGGGGGGFSAMDF